jgi:dTDP-4-dehydrorhamnose 3,5-epimerase-like enzyme
MAKLIKIPTFTDKRGNISIIEKFIGFKIKRVYYLYNFNNQSRGEHKHKKNIQFVVCLKGKIKINTIYKRKVKAYNLINPRYGLLLMPKDWHEIIPKDNNSILLVLASEFYNKNDYSYEI